MNQIPSIFISHSSLDKAFVDELVKQLAIELPDEKVFQAERIPSGSPWQPEILEHLEAARVLILLLTNSAEKSAWVGFEFGYFWKKMKGKNIHVLIHPKVSNPSPINQLQWKSIVREDDLQDFFERMRKHFKKKHKKGADINLLIHQANQLLVESQDEIELKENLINKVGSPINATARDAVRALRDRGWLKDGSLKGKDFSKANLENSDELIGADLQNTTFVGANLKSADLMYTNLEGANLGNAHFEQSILPDAPPRAAKLWHTILRNAILGSANLDNVNLGGADLRGADLSGATLLIQGYNKDTKIDTSTKLPTGQYSSGNLSDLEPYMKRS